MQFVARFSLLALVLVLGAASVSRAVTLRVVDEAGAPVAGARVDQAAVTDAAGALDAEAGSHCLSAAGFATQRVTLEAGAAPLVVKLRRAGTLRGRVVDTKGRALNGAALRASITELGDCAPSAVTDASGAYELTGLASGALVIDVTAPGHLPLVVALPRLDAGATRREDVRLRPSVVVSGNVAAADGRPFAGVTIVLTRDSCAARMDPEIRDAECDVVLGAKATTDASGRFALPELPRGPRWRIAFRADGFAPQSRRLAGELASERLDAKMMPGATLSLVAVDADDAAWAGVRATLKLAGDDDAALMKQPLLSEDTRPRPEGEDTRVRGRIVATHLPPGEAMLTLTAAGARPRVWRSIKLAEGRTTDLGKLQLEAGATLAGRVESDAREPLTEARVEVRGWIEGRREKWDITPAEDGAFRVEGLDPESVVDLEASAAGHVSPKSLSGIAAAKHDLVVTLELGATLVVSALDAETGEAIPDFSLETRAEGGRWWRDASWSEEGEARAVLSPSERRADLRVSASGYRPAKVEGVELAAGATWQRELRLDRGWTLRGRVVAGEPERGVAGAEVSTVTSDGAAGQSVPTSEDGSFLLEGLDGELDLRATHPQWMDARLAGVTQDEAAQVITLRMEAGGTLEGFVFDAQGKGREGRVVAVEYPESRSTWTGPDGSYRLEAVKPGRVTVASRERPGSWEGYEEAMVTIRAGETARHDFGKGLRVWGVVTRSGEPVEGVPVTLVPVSPTEAGPMQKGGRMVSGADGSYSVGAAAPGMHVLELTWRDRRIGHEIEIPAGVPSLRKDLEVPRLALRGSALRAEGGTSIAGARITATRILPDGTASSSGGSRTEIGGDDGERVVFSTTPECEATSAQDGSFELLLSEAGRWSLRSHWFSPDGSEALFTKEALALDVTEDRAGLALRLAAEEEKPKVLVTIRVNSGATGRPVPEFSVSIATGRNTMSHLDATNPATMEATGDEPFRVTAWSAGHAPVQSDEMTAGAGERPEVTLTLPSSGSLSVRAPEGSIRGTPFMMEGLRVLDESGVDLLLRFMQAIASSARAEGPDAWMLPDLPAGNLQVGLTGGPLRPVTIVPGSVAELDLR